VKELWILTFGVGLRNYLFKSVDEGLYGQISSKIRTQVRKYLSFIKIDEINFARPDRVSGGEGHFLSIHLKYTILPTDDVDILAINLPETIY
jgi:phage baseplate assembly protein W